jgi:hypothetical protein
MSSKINIVRIFIISLLFVLLISGCTAMPVPTPSKIPVTITPTVSDEKTPSLALSKTPTPRPTFTLTPVLTATPLSPQQRYKILQDLYENNGGCQLPCYWGIIPGKTLWRDASAFLSSLGRIYGPGGTTKVASYGVVFEGIDDPIGNITPTFWVEYGLVKGIGLTGYEVRRDFDYSLSGMLITFGEPEEIWIRPIAESSDDQPYYYLVLMYPSQGILVDLHGNAKKQDQYLIVCPQDMLNRSPFFPQLILWNPKEQVSFDNFGKHLLDDNLGWVMDEYRPLQMVSADKLTNQEFYDLYTEPNTKACLNVLPVR